MTSSERISFLKEQLPKSASCRCLHICMRHILLLLSMLTYQYLLISETVLPHHGHFRRYISEWRACKRRAVCLRLLWGNELPLAFLGSKIQKSDHLRHTTLSSNPFESEVRGRMEDMTSPTGAQNEPSTIIPRSAN